MLQTPQQSRSLLWRRQWNYVLHLNPWQSGRYLGCIWNLLVGSELDNVCQSNLVDLILDKFKRTTHGSDYGYIDQFATPRPISWILLVPFRKVNNLFPCCQRTLLLAEVQKCVSILVYSLQLGSSEVEQNAPWLCLPFGSSIYVENGNCGKFMTTV